MFVTSPYFKRRFDRHNEWVRKYNNLIQALRFGRQRCSKWWKQEHTYHHFTRYASFDRDVRRKGYNQAIAMWLNAVKTPLSKRRWNLIKQMARSSKKSRKQGNDLVDYLRSLILLEYSTRDNPVLYLFKPLIALRDSHLEQSKVGSRNIMDSQHRPVIDEMKHGKKSVTDLINNHKRIKAQILTLNTEFKPRYSAEDHQTTEINVHAQGLGFTTKKYTKNEQKHVEALIKRQFCDATGYDKKNVWVSCPKFTDRDNKANPGMILDLTDVIGREEKYPLLNQHDPKVSRKWKQIKGYSFYTGKQTRIPVLSKQVKQARNDYESFKHWKYNKAFVFACDNAVHHNLKWSLHFSQRATNNYRKASKSVLAPLALAGFYHDKTVISDEADRQHAVVAWGRHQLRLYLSANLVMNSQTTIDAVQGFVINCPETSELAEVGLDFDYINLTHQNYITKTREVNAHKLMTRAKSDKNEDFGLHHLINHSNKKDVTRSNVSTNTYVSINIIPTTTPGDRLAHSGIPPPLSHTAIINITGT